MSFLDFHRVGKRFPGVQALEDVSFQVVRGSCHALIGENGAGKSTLGKILAGVHTADAGEIRLEGRVIRPEDPLAARRLGIAMVHQELAFCPNLTVAENLCLGDLPQRRGFVDRPQMRARAAAMLAAIESGLDVDRRIQELSTGQEQMVQIAAAVGTGARILVMDEPTSSLTAHESERLFELLGHLKARRITVLYVSHRMDEIFRLCDTVSVLRDGRHVRTCGMAETNPDEVIRLMIGRDLAHIEPRHLSRELGPERLRVSRLSSPRRFRGVDLTVAAGEIVGLAGLVGAGRSELAAAVAGLDAGASGRVFIDGVEASCKGPEQRFEAGLGFLPEDRKRLGLVLSMNCRENTSLASLGRLTRFGLVRRQEEWGVVERHTRRLRVKTPTLEAPVESLSGGNQQKIAFAKWLARDSRMLIADEPTRGVDVGSKAEIHKLLDELACQGLGVLLISSELPELMLLCRRILVMREGRIAAAVDRAEFDEETLLRLMAGLDNAPDAGAQRDGVARNDGGQRPPN